MLLGTLHDGHPAIEGKLIRSWGRIQISAHGFDRESAAMHAHASRSLKNEWTDADGVGGRSEWTDADGA